MTVDDVKEMYDEPPGLAIPRFTLFTRECVGVLVTEIDRLTLLHEVTHATGVNVMIQVGRLMSAIRKHRDQRGDDRCWKDNDELYKALPEGYTPPETDTAVELSRCEQYIRMCHDPRTVYVSPQRRIEGLEAEVASLKAQLSAAYDRVAAQSELLSNRAEGKGTTYSICSAHQVPEPGCRLCNVAFTGLEPNEQS